MKSQNFHGKLRECNKIGEGGENPAWAPAECPGYNLRPVQSTSGMKAFIGQGNSWGKQCTPTKFPLRNALKVPEVGHQMPKFRFSTHITFVCNFLESESEDEGALKAFELTEE